MGSFAATNKRYMLCELHSTAGRDWSLSKDVRWNRGGTCFGLRLCPLQTNILELAAEFDLEDDEKIVVLVDTLRYGGMYGVGIVYFHHPQGVVCHIVEGGVVEKQAQRVPCFCGRENSKRSLRIII